MTKKNTKPRPKKARARRAPLPPAPITSIERLRELGDWMRRMNCLELVVDGVRIALGPDYGLPSEAPAGDVDTPPDAPGRGRRLTPPEGPILFASSGG